MRVAIFITYRLLLAETALLQRSHCSSVPPGVDPETHVGGRLQWIKIDDARLFAGEIFFRIYTSEQSSKVHKAFGPIHTGRGTRRSSNSKFFLWCCLCSVWTPPFTSTGPICLHCASRPASCVDWAFHAQCKNTFDMQANSSAGAPRITNICHPEPKAHGTTWKKHEHLGTRSLLFTYLGLHVLPMVVLLAVSWIPKRQNVKTCTVPAYSGSASKDPLPVHVNMVVIGCGQQDVNLSSSDIRLRPCFHLREVILNQLGNLDQESWRGRFAFVLWNAARNAKPELMDSLPNWDQTFQLVIKYIKRIRKVRSSGVCLSVIDLEFRLLFATPGKIFCVQDQKCQDSVEFLRALGNQSCVSMWQHTLVG